MYRKAHFRCLNNWSKIGQSSKDAVADRRQVLEQNKIFKVGINFHEAIELLNFWAILDKYKTTMIKISYQKSLIIFISCLFN